LVAVLLKPFVLKPLGCSPFTGKKFWQLWPGWPVVPVLVSALTGTASSGTTARARTATAKKSFLLKFISAYRLAVEYVNRYIVKSVTIAVVGNRPSRLKVPASSVSASAASDRKSTRLNCSHGSIS